MNRLILLVGFMGIAIISQTIKNRQLETQILNLNEQIGQMGYELDNLETKLHIDRESIQN